MQTVRAHRALLTAGVPEISPSGAARGAQARGVDRSPRGCCARRASSTASSRAAAKDPSPTAPRRRRSSPRSSPRCAPARRTRRTRTHFPDLASPPGLHPRDRTRGAHPSGAITRLPGHLAQPPLPVPQPLFRSNSRAPRPVPSGRPAPTCRSERARLTQERAHTELGGAARADGRSGVGFRWVSSSCLRLDTRAVYPAVYRCTGPAHSAQRARVRARVLGVPV